MKWVVKWPGLKDVSSTGQFLAQVRQDLGVAGWALMWPGQSGHPAFLKMCSLKLNSISPHYPSFPIPPHAPA